VREAIVSVMAAEQMEIDPDDVIVTTGGSRPSTSSARR